MKRVFSIALALCVALQLPALAENRISWQYGLQPPSQWLLQEERFQRIALGTLIRDIFGSAGGYSNLTVTPTTGLYVDVATTNTQPGAVYQIGSDDGANWGGGPINSGAYLSSDLTPIGLQGLLFSGSPTAAIGPLSVPGTSGQSQIALIECQVTTVDTNSQTANFISQFGIQSSQTVNRDRDDVVTCQSKEGTAATTPTVPTTDTGWVGVGYVTVPYGTSTITTGMVTALTSIATALQSTATAFDTVSVGPSNADSAVVSRLPLPQNVVVTSIAVVDAAVATNSYFNVCEGEGTETGAAPSNGATATSGQCVFTSDQPLPAGGTVSVFNAPTSGIYASGGELTLRIVTTGVGAGAQQVKVVVNGVI